MLLDNYSCHLAVAGRVSVEEWIMRMAQPAGGFVG